MSCCFSEEMLSVDLDLTLKSDGENGVNMQAVLFANPSLDVTIQKNGRNKAKSGVMTVKNVLSGITGFRVGNALRLKQSCLRRTTGRPRRPLSLEENSHGHLPFVTTSVLEPPPLISRASGGYPLKLRRCAEGCQVAPSPGAWPRSPDSETASGRPRGWRTGCQAALRGCAG